MKKYFSIFLFLWCTTWLIGQGKIDIIDHNHVALQVKDLQVAAKFYAEILQLESIPVPENLKAVRAWFKVGDYQIHLLDNRVEPLHDDRNGRHIALFVKSIDSAAKYLDQLGVKYHSQVRFDGVRQLYLADPDGHLIELNQKS
jgi:catechol 2,3-dioxygenase-like lactoylglutathione lyase family enzyme